jgi:succinate dehydrogenase / fumarate reductase cytochrome b subunit
VIIAGVHVSHGFWSAFQTIGADHPKYTPLIKGVSILLALVVAIGFGSLPVYISLTV